VNETIEEQVVIEIKNKTNRKYGENVEMENALIYIKIKIIVLENHHLNF